MLTFLVLPFALLWLSALPCCQTAALPCCQTASAFSFTVVSRGGGARGVHHVRTTANPSCAAAAAAGTAKHWLPAPTTAASVAAGRPASSRLSEANSNGGSERYLNSDIISRLDVQSSRRAVLGRFAISAASAALAISAPFPSNAAVDVSSAQPVEMKLYTDPLFTTKIPKRFYALRRTAKGDLPNAKTGSGRRGSSIFTAGDMAKAEVIAIERFPTRVLLEEAGVNPESIRDEELTSIDKIGSPQTVAELLALRRDRDKPGSANRSIVQADTIVLSPDKKTLTFSLRSKIDVQKPELLMEQMGVSELYRDTVCKATLEGEDGNVMAIFGSALSQDFDGPDGVALRESVDSFRALKGE